MENVESIAAGNIPVTNGLAEEFQLTPEHDRNHIFPKEKEFIKEIRELEPRVAGWPDRWILVFLLARKHDVAQTLEFLKAHIDFMVDELLVPIVKDGKNPVQWTRVVKVFFFEGHTIYRDGLKDKSERLLVYKINRYQIPKKSMYTNFMIGIAHWWYDAMEQVDLAIHRNGMALVFDMGGMSSKNWDFSSEGKLFQQRLLTMFPGRFRAGYVVNSNVLFKALYQFGRAIYKAKVMDRIKVVHKADLKSFIAEENIPIEFGGKWNYDVHSEWYDPLLERYRPKGPANAWTVG